MPYTWQGKLSLEDWDKVVNFFLGCLEFSAPPPAPQCRAPFSST